MSVQEQITRISGAKTSIAEAIAAKGVSVPSGTKIDGMAPLIANISEGEELDAELAEQDNLIAQIQTALERKAAGSGGGSVDTCMVTVDFSEGVNSALISTTVYEDGVFNTVCYNLSSTDPAITIENVVCGASLQQIYSGLSFPGFSFTGLELIMFATGNAGDRIYKVTAAAGETATLTVYDND